MEELFLQCIGAYLNNDSLSASLPNESDWHALFQLASEQKLLPVIFDVLHDSMPQAIVEQYRPQAVLQVARQTAHTAEFLQVYHELMTAGFQPIVVKGIIVRSAYNRPDMRISSDEDIFLRKEDYLAFHKKMKKMGFQTSDVPNMRSAHEERYLRKDFMIEGHWELFPTENDALNILNRVSDSFWTRAVIVHVDHHPLLTLEPTDHMTFLLLHAFKHFVSSGFGIRQICDISQWCKTHSIDWTRVHEILEIVHGEFFASAVFGVGERYFSMTFPPNWERIDYNPLLNDALSAGIYGTSTMSRKHSSTMTLGAVESDHRDKINIPLLSTLFPKRAVMESNFPWVQHTRLLLPVAWSIRIIRYLMKQNENNTPSDAIRIGKERTKLLKYYKIL